MLIAIVAITVAILWQQYSSQYEVGNEDFRNVRHEVSARSVTKHPVGRPSYRRPVDRRSIRRRSVAKHPIVRHRSSHGRHHSMHRDYPWFPNRYLTGSTVGWAWRGDWNWWPWPNWRPTWWTDWWPGYYDNYDCYREALSKCSALRDPTVQCLQDEYNKCLLGSRS
jgi:hypothetical protein